MGQNRQKLGNNCLDALSQVWQDGAAMNESEKQFSFTRAASSTSGRAKSKFPSGQLRRQALQADIGKADLGHGAAQCLKAGNLEQLSLRGGVCVKDELLSVPRLHPPRLVPTAR